MMLSKFIIKDVRCFAGEQSITLRPLTLLMGENSTGKSTVLGCYQALVRYMIRDKVNFNIPPYQMGAFSDIARSTGRGGRKCNKFSLGLEFPTKYGIINYSVILTEHGSEPIVSQATILLPKARGRIKIYPTDSGKQNTLFGPFGNFTFNVKKHEEKSFSVRVSRDYFRIWGVADFEYFMHRILRRASEDEKKPSADEKEFINFIKKNTQYLDISEMRYAARYINNISPIRSEPLRTYNPLSEEETPEGADVPMYLMRLARTDKPKWEALQKKLVKFGKAAGMFDDIDIKKLGKNIGDPFQIQFKTRGPKTNIMDVGYGVSQILPILVRLLAEKDRDFSQFLLQQPEVHLHPSGQAELASLFVNLADEENMFLVETHSDYIIDRVRMEIRKGNISPDDVSLVYHSPEKNSVKLHNISFDEQGNMVNVPEGFQQFIARETDAFLGLE